MPPLRGSMMDTFLIRKLYAAAFCVLVSCVGMTSGMRWLTVLALVLWIVAMLVLGRDPRRAAVLEHEGAVRGAPGEADHA